MRHAGQPMSSFWNLCRFFAKDLQHSIYNIPIMVLTAWAILTFANSQGSHILPTILLLWGYLIFIVDNNLSQDLNDGTFEWILTSGESLPLVFGAKVATWLVFLVLPSAVALGYFAESWASFWFFLIVVSLGASQLLLTLPFFTLSLGNISSFERFSSLMLLLLPLQIPVFLALQSVNDNPLAIVPYLAGTCLISLGIGILGASYWGSVKTRLSPGHTH